MFSKEQTEVLEKLEEVFGPTDEAYLKNVTSREGLGTYGYLHWIQRSMKEALISWMQYKHALTVDWDEVERVKREEEARRRAERDRDVIDIVMTGFLSGLLPKLSKGVGEDTLIEFDIESYHVVLRVIPDEGDEILMTYSKSQRTLRTTVNGAEQTEDVSEISGNASPREQLKGYDAVLTWLEGQASGG